MPGRTSGAGGFPGSGRTGCVTEYRIQPLGNQLLHERDLLVIEIVAVALPILRKMNLYLCEIII